MASWSFEGKMKLKPVQEDDENQDYWVNPNQVIWMESEGEEYYPQTNFSWSQKSVVVADPKSTIKYSINYFANLLAVDSDGNQLMIPGLNAPYEGFDLDEKHKGIHYLGEVQDAFEFKVELFDPKTLTKKIYKMVEVAEEDMIDYEIEEYTCKEIDPIDGYTIKNEFGSWVIEDYIELSNVMRLKN